jgi:cyclopropane-fatty-acyl-phospholipid synthase
MDVEEKKILPIMQNVYGGRDARRWLQRWRIFFMAVAELWGFDQGDEWLVSHYLLQKKGVGNEG